MELSDFRSIPAITSDDLFLRLHIREHEAPLLEDLTNAITEAIGITLNKMALRCVGQIAFFSECNALRRAVGRGGPWAGRS